MNYEIDNFTAILPVTCNANCEFCPEKESEKISKSQYIKNLVKTINDTVHLGYDHISISGGEPSLDPRFLKEVLNAILNETPIKKIGLTTNGLFLESTEKLSKFLDAIIDSEGNCLLNFINISRHSVRNDINNSIMNVSYHHTISDIIFFRKLLPEKLSFHINAVITEDSNIRQLFNDISIINDVLKYNNIDVAFRTDYRWESKVETLIPTELKELFYEYFGELKYISSCPTCITYSASGKYNNLYLKGANFEPTDEEGTIREIIFHMNGMPYIDWQRKKPFVLGSSIADELLGIITVLPLPNAYLVKIKEDNIENVEDKQCNHDIRGCDYPSGCNYSSGCGFGGC